jgi:hypothetical protein
MLVRRFQLITIPGREGLRLIGRMVLPAIDKEKALHHSEKSVSGIEMQAIPN